MKTYWVDNLRITLDMKGLHKYIKASYPVFYGNFSEVAAGDFIYRFNYNGEVKYITGSGPGWPHPAEWLKRTVADDWVYYSTGSYYTGVVDHFGEYYQPCPSYPSNSLFKENPFTEKGVAAAMREFVGLGSVIPDLSESLIGSRDKNLLNFLGQFSGCSPGYLRARAVRLHSILQARVSVLPPDCRHVDYDVIPLMITDGCMYNCSFCEVKTGQDLSCRPRHEIIGQLQALREFFGPDLQNYNSVYLGQHDALAADPEDIIFAAEKAYEILNIRGSCMQGPKLFLFGSSESFLHKKNRFWDRLNDLPFYTHVNLGLESFDEETLKALRKPVSSKVMLQAFERMRAINKKYVNIEITANFLLGGEFPAGHIPSIVAQIGGKDKGAAGKGCIYISPLKGSRNTRELLAQFRAIKQKSRLQTFVYLIQRL